VCKLTILGPVQWVLPACVTHYFHSSSHCWPYKMPPKASFRVKIPPRQQENAPLQPPTTTSFALLGTLAKQKLQWKSQQGSSSNDFHFGKTNLSKWDLNMPATSSQPNQSSRTVAYGMPTAQTPLSLPDIDLTMETKAHMDKGGYAAWDEPFPS
jgi:hypothetical protein